MGLIQTFTVIGSSLGIFSFLLNIIVPYSDYNRKKKEELLKLLKPEDLTKYINQIDSGFSSRYYYDSLTLLISDIRSNSENVQFKGLWGKSAKNDLNNICPLFNEILEQFESNNWKLSGYEHLSHQMEKDIYYKDAKTTKDLLACDKKLEEDKLYIINRLRKIETLYKSTLQKLNKLPIEYFYFWESFSFLHLTHRLGNIKTVFKLIHNRF